ncbi:MAG: ABC transporter ATP-binding protein [Nitrososphaeria archaeon]
MMNSGSVVVEMKGIVKRFPGVVANDHINLDLRSNEIHALLGENGAGKTTLMNILYGLYRADEGSIIMNGRQVTLGSPKDAIDLGIGMIHQHFTLIPPMTVTENIMLGSKSEGFLTDPKRVEEAISSLCDRYGLRVDPKARIWQLSVGEQQRVEIIKALYRGANILILDEPTAVLTPQETDQLFTTLRQMKKEGRALVFISHKLDEVLAISDQITVLRKGSVISTVNAAQTSKTELAKMMVERDVVFRLSKAKVQKAAEALKLEAVSALDDRGLQALKNVSFSVYEGEILGVAGVAGNGQRELAQLLTGIRKPTAGRIFIRGRETTDYTPADLLDLDVSYIPEDRIESGAILDLSVTDNLILKVYPALTKGLLLDRSAAAEHADHLIKEFDVVTPSRDSLAKTLSGGNIQRLILARELSLKPRVIVASQPTRGLDVGATEYIRRKFLAERERGSAILLISEDLEEIMSLSDRIAVLYEGRIMGIVPAEKAKIEEIGLMMAGTSVKPDKEAG